MPAIKYEINVAFEGRHDFTVTVDRNGPDNTNIQTAKFVLWTLQEAMGSSYECRMDVITTVTTRRGA